MIARRAALAMLAAGGLGGLAGCGPPPPRAREPEPVDIGGPFQLVDAEGRPVTERSLLRKPTLLFFGFTYCPQVCPTTLMDMTRWMKALGPEADRINAVFVSVDPERDTPERLKLYLSSFDPRIQGYTGTAEAVTAMVKAYHIYVAKVPLAGGDYTVDHSTAIYLLDARGRLSAPIPYGAEEDFALTEIRRVLRKG